MWQFQLPPDNPDLQTLLAAWSHHAPKIKWLTTGDNNPSGAINMICCCSPLKLGWGQSRKAEPEMQSPSVYAVVWMEMSVCIPPSYTGAVSTQVNKTCIHTGST